MAKFLIKFFSVIILLVSWTGLVHLFKIPKYIFPTPYQVFISLSGEKRLIFSSSLLTLEEAVLGFLVANLISVFCAFIISFKSSLEDAIMPLAVLLKTIPVIALTPLLVIWFGSGIYSKIATAALICFFPSLVNVLRGIKSLDRDFLQLFKVYSASRWQLIKMLIFPSILPYLFSALKVSSSLAVIGALVGEFIGANKGLGFFILVNYYNLNTPLVFAGIIMASLIGIAFYYTIHFIEKRAITWLVSIDQF